MKREILVSVYPDGSISVQGVEHNGRETAFYPANVYRNTDDALADVKRRVLLNSCGHSPEECRGCNP